MGKYLRLGLGILAGAAVGVVVYGIIKNRREKKSLVMPHVKKSKLHAARPPYAEGAGVTVE